jgi:hypothetical protein
VIASLVCTKVSSVPAGTLAVDSNDVTMVPDESTTMDFTLQAAAARAVVFNFGFNLDRC